MINIDRKKKLLLIFLSLIIIPLVKGVEVDYNDVFQPSAISSNYSFAYITPVNIDGGIDVINNTGFACLQFNVSNVISEFSNRYIHLYTRNNGLEENLNVSTYTNRCPTAVRHTRASPTVIDEYLPESMWNCSDAEEGYKLTNITHYVNGSDVLDDERLSIYFGAYYNITSVVDEVTGFNITFNVTFSNGTDTDTHNDITSYFAWYNQMNVTGIVTATLSSNGYTQRKYYETISSTNDITTSYSLIQSIDGLIVRFHIQNVQGNPITGASIKAYHSTYGVVEETTSDSSGVGTIFLYPYNTYTIEVTHPSYTSLNTSIQPTSQDYTITLGGISVVPAEEQMTNITYSILPTVMTVNSSQNTTFSFIIHSFDSMLEWFAFNVTYNNTQLFFQNSTNSSGGNITTTYNVSTLNWNASIVTYAIFKKMNVTNEFWINTSYFLGYELPPSGLTDIKSISDWLKTTLDLEHSQPYYKFFFSLGVIGLALVAGAFIPHGNGSGILSLIIIGCGIFLGLLSFFAAGSAIVVSVIFGLICLAYLSYMYLRGGL